MQLKAHQKLGHLYNSADYPESLIGLFSIEIDFPSVEPPNPDYSRFHTNPKRKRGRQNELPLLALRVGMAHCAQINPAHE